MTWFKVDDGFHAHRKVMALTETQTGRQAIALWTLAGSWSADQLSNGVIPKRLARKFGFTSREVQALLDADLWTESGDSYVFVDWADYQPTKAQVLEKREKERAKKQRVRVGVPEDVPGGQPEAVPSPPSRPVPSRPSPSEKGSSVESPSAPSPAAPDAEPKENLGDEIRTLEARYPSGLCAEARGAVALSRRNGKISDSVWLKTLRQLDAHPVAAATHAMRVFVERHADGDKGEAYLVAIARREASGGRSGARKASVATPATHDLFESSYDPQRDDPDLAWKEAANG